MKCPALAIAILSAVTLFAGCDQTPVPNVAVPGPDNMSAYRAAPQAKPLPPGTAQPATAGIQNQDAFLAAYAKHSPRIMIMVNRTLQGDSLPQDAMETYLQKEETQTSTGAVNVASSSNAASNGQSNTVVFGGQTAASNNASRNDASSFVSGGPAQYTHTTYWKRPADQRDIFGATSADYALIESSLVQYFADSPKVNVMDADTARAKLSKDDVLRVENGDPKATESLKGQVQADLLIRITASPTTQSQYGQAVRLIAKAVQTSDGRSVANSSVDMPLPMTRQNINIFTQYLASDLMGQLANQWNQADAPPATQP